MTQERLTLKTVSAKLLSARTCWQNVCEEAVDGCSTAKELVGEFKSFGIRPETLADYLSELQIRRQRGVLDGEYLLEHER